MATRTIDPAALVCADVALEGEYAITIGPGCVLGPRCTLRAASGPIELGRDNVVEELALIENAEPAAGEPHLMRLGDGNLVQAGAAVRALAVGDLNVFEVRSAVAAGCSVGTGCVVGATVALESGATLADGSVAFRSDARGPGVHTRQARQLAERHREQIDRYLEVLRSDQSKSALAKYHKLM